MLYQLHITVNDREHDLMVEPQVSLLSVLRNQLGLMGTKSGCNTGDCGACSVLIDGVLAKSCITNALTCQNRTVRTVEGLQIEGRYQPLQKHFVEHNAAQCGFCTPGMLMAATALLEESPHPQREEVREALSGNLCRCTGYTKIVDAVMAAAEDRSECEV